MPGLVMGVGVITSEMSQVEIDAAFNNGAVVPELPTIREDWLRRSQAIRAAYPDYMDLQYGERPRQRLDLFFAAARNAPTIAYIHGGYWQANDKENYAYVAEGPLAHGVNVAIVEHTLTPHVTMTELVAEIRHAVEWLYRNLGSYGADPSRLILSGHSAGGHLTAMLLDSPFVRYGISISGLFDLQPIRLSYLNKNLRLDDDEAERNSPVRGVKSAQFPILVTYGDDELPELQRQSIEFAEVCGSNGFSAKLLPLPGANHFTAVEALARPNGVLARKLKEISSGL